MKKKSREKIYTLKVFCQKCQTQLYQYHKQGAGQLIKCYKNMIVKDFTKGDLKCPKCGEKFARNAIIHNRPSNKLIGGRVFARR